MFKLLQYAKKIGLVFKKPHQRLFCSSSSVDLHSQVVNAQHSNEMLVLHGLYGSSSNWRGIANNLIKQIPSNIHLVDLRNHGSSPHAANMSYENMAKDVLRYIKKNNMEKVSIIGHSLGGRVAMKLSLEYPDVIQKLIVVDISPNADLNTESLGIFIKYMRAVDLSKIKKRNDVDEILREYIPDYGLRQFLLTNLVLVGDNQYRWKLNFDAIEEALPNLNSLNIELGKSFNGPTMFLYGSLSNYVKPVHFPIIDSLFPQNRKKELQAGHWVHADKPKEFVEAVVEFYKNT